MSEKPFYKHEWEKKNVHAFTPGTCTVPKKPNTITNLRKIEENAEEGNFQVSRVSKEVQLKIQQARASKGWSQAKLAMMCNLPEYVIKNYENGSAINNPSELSKIKRVLSI